MHSESRNGANVIWLAVHTTEGIMRAADLRAWTAWPGSSHASSDETGVLMTPTDGFVPYDLAAWTLRNGNHISENIEQCGWARWTRAEWLARPLLLNATARWLADRSKARGIPLVHLSLADIKARKPGVLGHVDYTDATGDGTHTDPGPNYPWDVVIDKARAYAGGAPTGGFLMALSDAQQVQLYEAIIGFNNGKDRSNFNYLDDKIAELKAPLAECRTALIGGNPPGQNNFHWLAGLLATAIAGREGVSAEAIAAAIPADIAEQVAQKLADRLSS